MNIKHVVSIGILSLLLTFVLISILNTKLKPVDEKLQKLDLRSATAEAVAFTANKHLLERVEVLEKALNENARLLDETKYNLAETSRVLSTYYNVINLNGQEFNAHVKLSNQNILFLDSEIKKIKKTLREVLSK